MEARAGRPPLTIITKLSQQEPKTKQTNAAVHPHPIAKKLLKSRSLSSTPTCSPSSSGIPPAPASTTANGSKQKLAITQTPTSRFRGYKYCADPDCTSPMTSEAVISRGTGSNSARTTPTSGASPHVATMSGDTYFKLLKKSQILEHVVQLSSNVGKSEQQVQRLQCEQARAQCVQDRVFAELERYRRQVVDVQQQFLGLVEALTGLCMREEEVQETNGPEHHNVSVEEQTLLDLERVTSPTAKASGSTIETQALATVGRQRVQQLEAICARYERQLVGSEAALSQVIYSDAARESAAKITQLEARNQQYEADKQALQVQLELARGQVAHLQDQLARTQEHRTTLEHANQQLEQEFTRHSTATQRFASDLQTELRRRYGFVSVAYIEIERGLTVMFSVVPSVLDVKWQHYFPRLSRPF